MGQIWYLEGLESEFVTIPDCGTVPDATSSGIPIADTRCCCVTTSG